MFKINNARKDSKQIQNEIEKLEVELFLEGLYQHYGFDFRNYAYSSLKRRLSLRANLENVKSISELQGKVFREPEIMKRLLNDLSINVTEMYRDPSFFKAFRTEVVPHLRSEPSIRIWHAGCSSGEEVYSMAILLHEEGLLEKSQIYATDMNETILEKAIDGEISIRHMKSYTKNYQQSGGEKEFSEYYTVNDDYVSIKPFLKENIVFAHHNLVTDHSFNEFHVIVCRNVFIYFNAELKNRVYHLFNESLSDNGFLCFGNKETITDRDALTFFKEVDPIEKIYRKESFKKS
ncbi:chemotaxis protein methyltransferase CheR [Evansella vedderi]|uniref:Chemotaxis protein methyltransferase CheR n=1 Tax=Evansella vedderi TaxID=38282 RepID=A0ABT9ZXU5_9BACI|nr:protein-glutamate O-methyltransferase CheR [Evansella vedderi]MDQ0255785.1 chemotaxis protein methyltransferase CheR [Evansella vedderi]